MLVFIVGLLVTLPLALLDGWVASVLWGWFVVPLFAVPPLPVVMAAGVVTLIGLLTHQQQRWSKDEDEWEILCTAVAWSVIHPLVCLSFGWILYLLA